MGVSPCDRRYSPPDAGPHGPTRAVHNAHLAQVVHYRWHPLCGQALTLCGRVREGAEARFVAEDAETRRTSSIPIWMLSPTTCSAMHLERKPQVALSALLELCQLLADARNAAATSAVDISAPTSDDGDHEIEQSFSKSGPASAPPDEPSGETARRTGNGSKSLGRCRRAACTDAPRTRRASRRG